MLVGAGNVVKEPGPVAVRIWPATVHVPFTLASMLVAWVGGVVASVVQARIVVSVLAPVTAAGDWVSVNVVLPVV
jgi:hypothetical protein